MDNMQQAIQKAVDAIAAAANEVAVVDARTKTAPLAGTIPEEAQQYTREVVLALSEATGGLLELHEFLEGTFPTPTSTSHPRPLAEYA